MEKLKELHKLLSDTYPGCTVLIQYELWNFTSGNGEEEFTLLIEGEDFNMCKDCKTVKELETYVNTLISLEKVVTNGKKDYCIRTLNLN